MFASALLRRQKCGRGLSIDKSGSRLSSASGMRLLAAGWPRQRTFKRVRSFQFASFVQVRPFLIRSFGTGGGFYLQIQQLRVERANLQRLTIWSQSGGPLTGAEEAAIQGLWRTARHHPEKSTIETGKTVRLITSGWAAWLRYAEDGRRLIFLFLMPGDYIVPEFSVPESTLIGLTPVRTVDATALAEFDSTAASQASVSIQQTAARYRRLLLDHLTRLMMGSTTSSVASLLSEFHGRSLRSGACAEGRFSFPIGQRMLGSALGRSSVQVSKIMCKFQADGLIRVGFDWLEVREPAKLQSLAGIARGRTPG
jgi:CRP-like cAMP-binding protein